MEFFPERTLRTWGGTPTSSNFMMDWEEGGMNMGQPCFWAMHPLRDICKKHKTTTTKKNDVPTGPATRHVSLRQLCGLGSKKFSTCVPVFRPPEPGPKPWSVPGGCLLHHFQLSSTRRLMRQAKRPAKLLQGSAKLLEGGDRALQGYHCKDKKT